MVDHFNVSYLYKKRGVFYFSKRIPCDVKPYYKSDRIVICLRTKFHISSKLVTLMRSAASASVNSYRSGLLKIRLDRIRVVNLKL